MRTCTTSPRTCCRRCFFKYRIVCSRSASLQDETWMFSIPWRNSEKCAGGYFFIIITIPLGILVPVMALLTINVIWYASTWHDIVADTMIRYTLIWLIVIFHHTIRYHVIGCNMISYCILSYDMERLTLYEIIMYHMISYNEICYHIRVTTWNHWNDFIWLNII